MKLSQRSYPHPVVGNADDVQDAAYQATVEMTTDKENIYLDAKTLCSSSTLNKLIKSGGATFVVHVECSNTLYRRLMSSRIMSAASRFPGMSLTTMSR